MSSKSVERGIEVTWNELGGFAVASFNFKGESFVQNYHRLVQYHELAPVEEESCSGSLSITDNLGIGGGVQSICVDEETSVGDEEGGFRLVDDGATHHVRVLLGRARLGP